jgi:hypothetical protein
MAWEVPGGHKTSPVVREGLRLRGVGKERVKLAARSRVGGGGGGVCTHCEGGGPTFEPRGDLGVLVCADCPGWGAQIRHGILPRISLDFLVCVRGCVLSYAATAQVHGTVYDGAPDRDGLGERIGESLARARRVYENESVWHSGR